MEPLSLSDLGKSSTAASVLEGPSAACGSEMLERRCAIKSAAAWAR